MTKRVIQGIGIAIIAICLGVIGFSIVDQLSNPEQPSEAQSTDASVE